MSIMPYLTSQALALDGAKQSPIFEGQWNMEYKSPQSRSDPNADSQDNLQTRCRHLIQRRINNISVNVGKYRTASIIPEAEDVR